MKLSSSRDYLTNRKGQPDGTPVDKCFFDFDYKGPMAYIH